MSDDGGSLRRAIGVEYSFPDWMISAHLWSSIDRTIRAKRAYRDVLDELGAYKQGAPLRQSRAIC
jgi:hypothetical protein